MRGPEGNDDVEDCGLRKIASRVSLIRVYDYIVYGS